VVSRHGRRSVTATRPRPGPPRNHQPTLRDASAGRLNAQDDHLPDLVGYRVLGRYGELGTVVEVERVEGDVDDRALVVRGGVSDALMYHIPSRRVVSVSSEAGTVIAEVDAADFVPRVIDDGTVVLHLRS